MRWHLEYNAHRFVYDGRGRGDDDAPPARQEDDDDDNYENKDGDEGNDNGSPTIKVSSV